MKKICLLLTLTMCLTCLLVGCGNDTSKNNDVESSTVFENTDSIQYVFKTTFEVEKPEYYDFNVLYESNQDFSVYEIKNRVAELKTATFTRGDAIYEKQSTMEYDIFDMFLYRNGELSPLMEAVSSYRLNFEEITSIMEQYHSNYETELDVGKLVVEGIINGIYNKNLMKDRTSPNYQLESTACYNFNLGNYDYEWLIWESLDDEYATNDIFAAKFETEEQKEKLLEGIEYRYNNLVNSLPEVFDRTEIKENTKVYEFDNVLIWVSVMHDNPKLFEYIEQTLAEYSVE